MKIAIIITILLIIFGSAGYYVYTRTMQAFLGTFVNSIPVLILYLFLITSFFFGKLIEHYSIGIISNTLVKIGSVALGFFLYAFLIVVFFDFIHLIHNIVPIYPKFITADFQKIKLIVGIISVVFISAVFIKGYMNARFPVINKLNLTIHKKKASFDTLHIVAVSDIHLGTVVNKTKALQLIKTVNGLNPDLVIIAGDMADDNIEIVKYFKLLEYFKEINAKYGVYACLGNHDYISGAYKDLNYFEKNGIHILKDTVQLVDNQFYIIGRDDIQGRNIAKKERKSLNELTNEIDFNLPVFLLDHQPYKLDETTEYAVDLQFSGHTHKGQVWPFNYITNSIFEKDWGYLKKKNTHFYISSGYGTSVIPIRVGNRSEIVSIQIRNE